MSQQQIRRAQALMQEFAEETGLFGPQNVPRRYLWTDAWAVCNYLGFYRQSGDKTWLELALALVSQVHEILGKHRQDSRRHGWLNGLSEEKGRQHPTLGGLRIGKPLAERAPNEQPDETLEWQQDGQYFHYLTRWMHALDCVSTTTGEATYHQWALELARTATRAFLFTPAGGGQKRMYWKMSIDLSRPLVDSMGYHDPLDGLITCQQLAARAGFFTASHQADDGLNNEIRAFSAMCKDRHWATGDELGAGSLFCDAYRMAQLLAAGLLPDSGLLERLLIDADNSLVTITEHSRLGYPAEFRVAFRELGLATGLQAIDRIARTVREQPEQFRDPDRLFSQIQRLQRYARLHERIVSYWLDPAHYVTDSWREHRDINQVMLATSLAPDGYLLLLPDKPSGSAQSLPHY